jgi:diguanylate cyclase (GGDEF)-like protein
MSDLRSPARPLDRARAAVRPVLAAVSRPTGMVEGTRWLFWLLAILSLALSTPAPLLQGRTPSTLPAIAAVTALAASLTIGYLSRRARWGLDLLDGLAVVVLACSGPSPATIFALVFAMIWFRSLYGSAAGALLRCTLYAGAMPVILFLWPVVVGSAGGAQAPVVLSAIPTMFVTVVAARHLFGILRDRQQEAQRDAIHAAAGAMLLGVTDLTEIRRVTWQAVSDICVATPGLRVLGTQQVGEGLQVVASTGSFDHVPTTLSSAVRGTLEQHQGDAPAMTGLAELDATVGLPCLWHCLPAFDQSVAGWMILGSPRRLPEQAVVTLTSLVTQGLLAMRNGQAHRELTVQATLDSLTGLANRALFNTALSTTLAAADGTETAVLFVDLDDFKDVNDLLGHSAGDELLREVAARITVATRTDDLCARLGGDEFAVLLPRTSADEATAIARRIVTAVGGRMNLTAGVAQVGASVGLAVDVGDSTPDQIVQRADIAMYAAKAGGKGRMQLFSAGLLQGDSVQAAFERQLSAAAANDELVVHYQPVVSLPDARCTAVEALVRWQHPERGLLDPGHFIAAAERTGAIRDIGMFVLRQACADAADWRGSRPGADLAVHVNVSALQLDDDAFCDEVLRCLEEFSMPADELVLEITETVVISSPAAIDTLNTLAAHGVVVAIDDFGTGYSALTTLRSLPVSIVKIDASFVAGSTVNPRDRAVTEAVVQMASRMGMRTIAEGVERPDQQALLESIGADAAQGFLYLRPAPADDLVRWLDAQPAPASTPGDVVVSLPRRHAVGRA